MLFIQKRQVIALSLSIQIYCFPFGSEIAFLVSENVLIFMAAKFITMFYASTAVGPLIRNYFDNFLHVITKFILRHLRYTHQYLHVI